MQEIIIQAEAVLATGAIDAVLSEFNCTLPGIEPICEELKIKQICLDDVAKRQMQNTYRLISKTGKA